MDMINTHVLVGKTDTKGDVINKICQETLSDADEPICFSAIYNRDKRKLILNIVEDNNYNVFSAKDVVSRLIVSRDKKAMFVQPSLELYIEVFKPMLEALACKYASERKCTKEEVLSDLYQVIINLTQHGYYLSKSLIKRAYTNYMHTQYRDNSFVRNTISINSLVADTNKDEVLTLSQVLSNANEQIDKEFEEYKQELYQAISEVMIEELGDFMFKRVLHQVATNTIDNTTSRILLKYRQKFNNCDNMRCRKSKTIENPNRLEIKLLTKKGDK